MRNLSVSVIVFGALFVGCSPDEIIIEDAKFLLDGELIEMSQVSIGQTISDDIFVLQARTFDDEVPPYRQIDIVISEYEGPGIYEIELVDFKYYDGSVYGGINGSVQIKEHSKLVRGTFDFEVMFVSEEDSTAITKIIQNGEFVSNNL